MVGAEGEKHLLAGRELFVVVDLDADLAGADPHLAIEEIAEIDGVDHLTVEQIVRRAVTDDQVAVLPLRTSAKCEPLSTIWLTSNFIGCM